jgi:hypothetical protein
VAFGVVADRNRCPQAFVRTESDDLAGGRHLRVDVSTDDHRCDDDGTDDVRVRTMREDRVGLTPGPRRPGERRLTVTRRPTSPSGSR